MTYRKRSCRTLLCFVLHRGYSTFAVHREKSLFFPSFFKVSVGKFGEHSKGYFTPLSCSPNFPHAQYIDIRTLTHELIVNHIFFLISDTNADCIKVRSAFLFEFLQLCIWWPISHIIVYGQVFYRGPRVSKQKRNLTAQTKTLTVRTKPLRHKHKLSRRK